MFRKENGGIDMVSLILTIVIAAIVLMVGIIIVAQMNSGMPLINCVQNDTYANLTLHNFTYTSMGSCAQASTFATTNNNILTNTGTAFTFLALGLFIMAAVFIVGIVAGVLGKE